MASALFAPEPVSRRRISLVQIDAAVSARLGPTRTLGNAQPACFNRQVAMYLAKHLGGWSTTVIGRFYNGRDHSTVCYSIQRIEALRESDPDVDALISDLRRQLGVKAPNACVPSDGKFDSATLTETAIDNLANLISARVCGYIEKRMAQSVGAETGLVDRDRQT